MNQKHRLEAILRDVNKALLKRYIALALKEAHDARVPQQLVGEPDEGPQEDEGAEDVYEFSGVGAIAGYTGPLGMDPDKLGRSKNKRMPRKK